MSKNRAKAKGMSPVQLAKLTETLEQAALERAMSLGHMLGLPGTREWTSAKKKFGHHSKKAYCGKCGKMAIIMPLGNVQAKGGTDLATAPGVRGEAVFDKCPQVARVGQQRQDGLQRRQDAPGSMNPRPPGLPFTDLL